MDLSQIVYLNHQDLKVNYGCTIKKSGRYNSSIHSFLGLLLRFLKTPKKVYQLQWRRWHRWDWSLKMMHPYHECVFSTLGLFRFHLTFQTRVTFRKWKIHGLCSTWTCQGISILIFHLYLFWCCRSQFFSKMKYMDAETYSRHSIPLHSSKYTSSSFNEAIHYEVTLQHGPFSHD